VVRRAKIGEKFFLELALNSKEAEQLHWSGEGGDVEAPSVGRGIYVGLCDEYVLPTTVFK